MKKPLVVFTIFLTLMVVSFSGCTNQNNPNKLFAVTAPSTVTEGDSFEVTVTADGNPVSDVNVTFNKISKFTDSNGKVTFSAPQVVTDLMRTITAMKEGYVDNTTNIIVLNFPALQVVAQKSVSIGNQFPVVVADDNGNAVIGVTVTFNGQTNLTGANGVTTLTASMQPGNYTITANFSGFRNATTTIKVE